MSSSIGLGRLLAHPPANKYDEICTPDTRQQLGVWSDAEIAGIAGMIGSEEMGAAERGGNGQREALGEASYRGTGGLRPPAAAEEHDGALGCP